MQRHLMMNNFISGDETNSVRRRGPISLDELIQQKKSQLEDTGNPVYLTKAQRRAQAIRMREEEVRIRQACESHPSSYGSGAKHPKQSNAHPRSKHQDDSEDPTKQSHLYTVYDGSNCIMSAAYEKNEREREIEEIKRAKLGIVEKRTRIVKPSDKFNTKPTHWDASEDTSQDINTLYTNRVLYQPQFGTGLVAGIDLEKQLKNLRDQATNRRDLNRYEDQLRRVRASYSDSGLHWSEKRLDQMTTRDWRIFKEDNNISTKGGGMPHPIRSWSESGLPEWAMECIKECGYKTPSPIQMQALPIGLQNRDLIGIAETGSGKTVAFILPLLVHVSTLPPLTAKTEGNGPYACILAPTRELALQIEQEASKFAKHTTSRVVALVGGVDIQIQVSALRQGCELVIATPGRLVDLLRKFYLVLSQCNYVVLDEGDQMIDLGFESQLLEILDAMPQAQLKSQDETIAYRQENDANKVYRTTVFFSATMPPAIERMANKYLRRPAYVYIGEVGRTVDRIKQVVEFVKGEGDKRRRLQDILEHGSRPPIIIFMNQKKNCDLIAKFLSRLGYITAVLHSSRTQEQRELAMEQFRAGDVDILVATNVAGRGLDVKGVTHVINYDLPKTIDEYTHRIGRTGRAGEDGLATSFLTRDDVEIMPGLKQMLLKTGNKIPKELHELAQANASKPMY